MNRNSLIIIIVLICTILAVPILGQTKTDNRFPYQSYYEDSLHVYWTWFPNPFSPSTINDTSKGQHHSGYAFYCDLSDTVIVSLVDENDTIQYSAPVITIKRPYFSFYYWLAGSRINQAVLPKTTIRSHSVRQYKLLLSVNGRQKCLMTRGVIVPNDKYFWLTDMYQVNK